MASIAKLQRIQATTLADLVLKRDPHLAIVDVRDDDYIGGHIKGSMNFPSLSLDATMPTLLRKLENKQTVVFHCALSQERGPRAALRYLRERESQAASEKKQKAATDATEQASEGPSEETKPNKAPEQVVYVLDQGFVGWQSAYGNNQDLTEGYRPEIWEVMY